MGSFAPYEMISAVTPGEGKLGHMDYTFLISLNTDSLLCRKGDGYFSTFIIYYLIFNFRQFDRYNMVVYSVWLCLFLIFSLVNFLLSTLLLTPLILFWISYPVLRCAIHVHLHIEDSVLDTNITHFHTFYKHVKVSTWQWFLVFL